VKRAKLERRLARAVSMLNDREERLASAEEDLARLRALRLSIWTDAGEIYAQTLGELQAEDDRGAIAPGEPLAGVAARSPNVFLGYWRVV
jgi:hypothetical protein